MTRAQTIEAKRYERRIARVDGHEEHWLDAVVAELASIRKTDNAVVQSLITMGRKATGADGLAAMFATQAQLSGRTFNEVIAFVAFNVMGLSEA